MSRINKLFGIGSIRYFSNKNIELSLLTPTLSNKRIFFYALPLTTKKTFIHCKYNDNIFPNGEKTLENKLIGKFQNIWTKFSTSDSNINKKIVSLINKFLSKIPWIETCLMSIPSQKFITRKLKEDEKFVTHNEIINENIESDYLERFDFYYPNKLTNMDLIMNNFKPEFKSQYEIHKSGILKDILLMPLTIPFALVPLLPNVPGFYLLYRIYCHIKVISALKFLVTLLKDGHFNYNKIDEISEIYLNTKDEEIRSNIMNQLVSVNNKDYENNEKYELQKEKLLLSEDVASEICKAFGDEECTDKLIFAIQQERKHLKEKEEKDKAETAKDETKD